MEREEACVITISGLPGSGKSTIARLLVSKLGLSYFSVGKMFRDLAAERKIDLLEVSHEAEKNYELDRLADKKMVEFVKTHSNCCVLVDGRVAPWILRENNIKSYNIYLTAPLAIRARRISGRDKMSYPQAYKYTKERESSEAARYLGVYNIDIRDKSVYDLIINGENLTIEEILFEILNRIQKYGTINSKSKSGDNR